jgi:hypothetical protein
MISLMLIFGDFDTRDFAAKKRHYATGDATFHNIDSSNALASRYLIFSASGLIAARHAGPIIAFSRRPSRVSPFRNAPVAISEAARSDEFAPPTPLPH